MVFIKSPFEKLLFYYFAKKISVDLITTKECLIELLGSESKSVGGLEFLNKYGFSTLIIGKTHL